MFGVICVTLLCLKGVLGQNGWRVTYEHTQICAVRDSYVDIPCSYSYPHGYTVRQTLWFKEQDKNGDLVDLRLDSEYKQRVHYYVYQTSSSTLRINNVRLSDSGRYWFRFVTNGADGKYTGEPGVELSVTDLQVDVETESTSRITLTCKTTCDPSGNSNFHWYKNGVYYKNGRTIYIYSPSSDYYTANKYYCAFTDLHQFPSNTVTVRGEHSPQSPLVSVLPAGDIVEHTSVTLSCSSDANPPVHTYTWFKGNGAAGSERDRGQSYTITNIRPADSGQYYCVVQNKHGAVRSSNVHLDVHYGPRDVSVSVLPAGDIVEHTSVTLSCSSDANPPVHTYTWFKGNEMKLLQTGVENNYTITDIKSEDSGEYYCVVENQHGADNTSVIITAVTGSHTAFISTSAGLSVLVVLVLVFAVVWKCSAHKEQREEVERQDDAAPVYENVCDGATTHLHKEEELLYSVIK